MKIENNQLPKMNLQLLAGEDPQVDNPIVNNGEGHEGEQLEKEEKTFTQSELEEIISKRLAREAKKIEKAKEQEMQAKLDAELKESERLAQMSEAEKARALAEKQKRQFEEERKQFEEEMRAFNQEKMFNTTMKTLNEKELPVEFASFLKGESADDIMENIANFEKGFKQAVDKAVAERLRGKTPSLGTTSKSYSKESLKGMSMAEINANWDKIKNNLR